MEDFLDWYFGLDYVSYIALGLIFVLILVYFLVVKYYKKKSKRTKYYYIGVLLILVFNYSAVTFINPSYWGYGTPKWFSLIQVTDDHVILYDKLISYIPERHAGDQHDEFIPSLRIHVVDRKSHKKLYSKLIGDYYFTRQYGDQIVLIEHSTYSRDNGISSIDIFDIKKKDVRNLVEVGETIQVGDQKIKVYDIKDEGNLIVRSKVGDKYKLNPITLDFSPDTVVQKPYSASKFRLSGMNLKSEKKQLMIDRSETELFFLFGEIVNEHVFDSSSYILIHAYGNLDREEPYVTVVNDSGKLMWSKNINDFKKDAAYDGFELIYRTLLVDSLCYITLDHYLFEYDLLTGKKNWVLGL